MLLNLFFKKKGWKLIENAFFLFEFQKHLKMKTTVITTSFFYLFVTVPD